MTGRSPAVNFNDVSPLHGVIVTTETPGSVVAEPLRSARTSVKFPNRESADGGETALASRSGRDANPLRASKGSPWPVVRTSTLIAGAAVRGVNALAAPPAVARTITSADTAQATG